MRLYEFEDDLSALTMAAYSWMALEHDSNDINTILNHPASQQFKQTSANAIYRVVFKPYKTFLKKGVVQVKPQKEGFVAYSTHDLWGSSARDDFDYNGDMLRFRKNVIPGDIILDFTALVKFLVKNNQPITNIDEGEVWVKPTPYYTTFFMNEFVDAELRNGSIVTPDPDVISDGRKLEFYKHMKGRNVDPYYVAEYLGIPEKLVPTLMANFPDI